MNENSLNDSAFAEGVRAFLDARFAGYLEMLGQMVSINSYTENPAGVNRLGDYTAELFSRIGFTAERVQSVHGEYGNHLLLRRGAALPSIGLVAHLDTVFHPEEEAVNDFHFRISGDRVYGPGTVDVKGGTLIIYMLLDALTHLAPAMAEQVSWHVLLDASEETESSDFGELCVARMGNQPLACLIYEGGETGNGEYRVVTARKGRANFRIVAQGRGAHAGVDHPSGVNAIVQLAQVIPAVHEITDYTKDITVNIGSIEGGGPLNRVPHQASMEVEIRSFDPAILEEGIAKITALNGFPGLVSGDGDYRGAIKAMLTQRCPAWPENPRTENLFQCFSRSAAVLGYRMSRENRGGLSDGNYIWDRLPVLDGLGPAGGNAHCSERHPDGSKDQEYAWISSFIPKTILSALTLRNIINKE